MTFYDIHGKPFSDTWVAEFRGMFWGEGNLSLTIIHRKGTDRVTFRARVRMGLRADDDAVLRLFKERLGGSFFRPKNHKYHKHPLSVWDCTNQKGCAVILDMLSNPELPAKKAKQVAPLKEALHIMGNKAGPKGWGGAQYSDEQYSRLKEISDELSSMKEFDC